MQVKVYLANLKLNRIYHFEKQKIIANDYLTQTDFDERLFQRIACGRIKEKIKMVKIWSQ